MRREMVVQDGVGEVTSRLVSLTCVLESRSPGRSSAGARMTTVSLAWAKSTSRFCLPRATGATAAMISERWGQVPTHSHDYSWPWLWEHTPKKPPSTRGEAAREQLRGALILRIKPKTCDCAHGSTIPLRPCPRHATVQLVSGKTRTGEIPPSKGL